MFRAGIDQARQAFEQGIEQAQENRAVVVIVLEVTPGDVLDFCKEWETLQDELTGTANIVQSSMIIPKTESTPQDWDGLEVSYV